MTDHDTAPETIEARQLCGEHVGRIVQFTTKEGVRFEPGPPSVPVGGELAAVEHFGSTVRVALRGLPSPGPSNGIGGFELQPTDKIVVDAFKVVASR